MGLKLFLLLPFKSTASGEVGSHGQHAPKAVVVATKPVRESVMIPLQIMVAQHARELTKKVILVINRTVQVKQFSVLLHMNVLSSIHVHKHKLKYPKTSNYSHSS